MTVITEQGVDDNEQRDALFSHLPPSLFAPLASSAKRDYSRLILSIYRRFFSEDYTDFLRLEEVIAFLKVELDRYADIVDEFSPDSHNADVSQDPTRVYHKLKDAGWLVEHKRGYVIAVDLDPSVSMLLETLNSIEEGEAIHFGGTIAALESVIERLGENPADKASSLADSAQRARRFQQHMTAVVSSLRAYENMILNRPEPELMLARFFEDFVENILIADYRALKTTNNPFRHRARIIAMISSYEHDDDMVEAFAEGYVSQGLASNIDNARHKVRQHLQQVKTVFIRAEDRLDQIDEFRIRLERRITRTIAYMSEVDAEITGRLTSIMKNLCFTIENWDDDVPVISDLTDPARCWGPDNLYTPRGRRTTADPDTIVIQDDDPAMLSYDRAKRDYLLKITVTAKKIEAYLDSNIGEKDVIDAADFTIEDTEQALIFQRMRMLQTLGNAELNSRYRITIDESKRIVTEWSECSAFHVERITSAKTDQNHAV